MKLTVIGEPWENSTDQRPHPKHIEYKGYIIADDGQCLRFGFRTGEKSKRSFTSYIGSDQFSELAQMMIEADPEAAIRAFGLAMQDFGTEKAAGKTAA